jgi:beta-1,4-mannosyltransferase
MSFRRSASSRQNPYLDQLIDAVSAGFDVAEFSWQRALLGRYDVLHVHWPEQLIRSTRRSGQIAKTMMFGLLLIRLTCGWGNAVQTLHNAEPHEQGGWLERRMLGRLGAVTRCWITLTERDVPRSDAPSVLIPHGHYRDWFDRIDRTAARVPGRVLTFGALRKYKGISDLVTFVVENEETLQASGHSFRICGLPEDVEGRGQLEDLFSHSEIASGELAFLTDEQLKFEILSAELVLLPYHRITNSGSALLALSLGRPVAMPASSLSEALQREFGADWVHTYEALTPRLLTRSALGQRERNGRPPMGGRDWETGARLHAEVYARAIARRIDRSGDAS